MVESSTEEHSRPVEELVGTPPSTCSTVPSLDLRQFLSWTDGRDQPPPGVKKELNHLKDSLFESGSKATPIKDTPLSPDQYEVEDGKFVLPIVDIRRHRRSGRYGVIFEARYKGESSYKDVPASAFRQQGSVMLEYKARHPETWDQDGNLIPLPRKKPTPVLSKPTDDPWPSATIPPAFRERKTKREGLRSKQVPVYKNMFTVLEEIEGPS